MLPEFHFPSVNEYKKTGVVVVAYHPDAEVVERVLAIAKLVDFMVVVDNTPASFDLFSASAPNVLVVSNRDNAGIAAALNQGVVELFAHGCSLAILLDQDSEPDQSFFQLMTQEFIRIGSLSATVAQIAPAYFDVRMQQLAPFIRIEGVRVMRVAARGTSPISADYVITSGACISKSAWDVIGPMDERLFIDCVDIEWGLRAKKLGWQTYGIPSVVMQHCLGEQPVSVFGKKYPLHTPLRHYYFFRNTISLIKRRYIPIGWKLNELYKLPLRFFVYALFAERGRRHARMMLKGVLHGLINKTGRLDE